MPANLPTVAKARPAETLSIAAAGAFLLARAFGVDNDQTITALAVVIGFVPAAVTWLVNLVFGARPRGIADVADELRKLHRLQAGGIISKTEFDAEKRRLLGA